MIGGSYDSCSSSHTAGQVDGGMNCETLCRVSDELDDIDRRMSDWKTNDQTRWQRMAAIDNVWPRDANGKMIPRAGHLGRYVFPWEKEALVRRDQALAEAETEDVQDYDSF